MFGSRLNRDGRMVFPFAIAEAQDLGHESLAPEHLILGVLCNARDPLIGVLAEHGITLEAAREAVRGAAGADGRPSSEQDRYAEDRDALKLLGIDLDTVRAAVQKNFGDDLTAGWGRRADRRGHSHRGHRGHRGRRGGSPEFAGCRPGMDPRDGERSGGRGPWRGGDEQPWSDEPGSDGPGRETVGAGDGPWDYGRGRRGPRGHGGRARFALTTKRALADAVRMADDDGGRAVSTADIVAAVLDVDSPVVAAIIAFAPDADALRRAVTDVASADATT